ncbi:MAG: VOC family protein [Myxococcales bacterium]|nr:VOC family protein [Myxococcales bacterium]MCB9716087.1 VOC family protein [Myxococcales bacterium]
MSTFALDHIVILATDLEASLRFYERVLGPLGFVRERDHLFGRDGLYFDLRPASTADEPRSRGRPGVDHLGFVASSREQVDALYEVGRSLGPEVARRIEFDDGDYSVFLRDPDGVRIELTCYAAGQ